VNSEWDHKDEWRKEGKGFLVQVTRHNSYSSVECGKGRNRWAVYAYIYPSHPYFQTFHGDDMFQCSARNMPLHGGPSLLQWHKRNDGAVASVQVGADYDHLHDNHYTFMATKDDAQVIFADAQSLFDWLTIRAGEPVVRAGAIS
jgi:hypothetical protein